MKATHGKYLLSDHCDWCPETSNLREIKIQTNGVKSKRYVISATACPPCELRLLNNDESDSK